MDRPEVWLNCATSHDGRLAASDGSPVRFSDDLDMQRVHLLRARCDAILVGLRTVLTDDPHLTVKTDVAGLDEVEQPMRVVLDANGRIPLDSRVLDHAAPTLLVTGDDAPPIPGAYQVHVKATDGLLELDEVLRMLQSLGVHRLLVEGGATVMRSFLDAGAWDRFTLYQAPDDLSGDGPRLWDQGGPEALDLTIDSKEPHGDGTLWVFSP